MDIGIGIPSAFSGMGREFILDWARRAESGPFSALGVIDRLVHYNHDPLITLAMLIGVTSRIRLMTAVLLAPLRNTGVLAKQVASLDVLSGGRLSLGMGVGRREDDFLAAPAEFHTRGARFEEQLAMMKRVWSGDSIVEGLGSIGPTPTRTGGPEILIGGRSHAAVRRAGRWADGYLAGLTDPATTRQFYDIALETREQHSRKDKFRLVGINYFALGPRADEHARTYIEGYYGPNTDHLVRAVVTSRESAQESIQSRGSIGMDELIFLPCVAEAGQVEMLADILG